MTNEQLRERVEKLIELPIEHPAYSHYCWKYIKYIKGNQTAIGLAEAEDMLLRIPQKLPEEFQDKEMVFHLAVKDLGTIRRSKEIVLNRLPIAYYVFARTICSEFLREIKPNEFTDSLYKNILSAKRPTQHLLDLFLKMKNSTDYYVYYSRFRKVMLLYLLNNILIPDDVKGYIPVVEAFEEQIESLNQYFNLIDESNKLMLNFERNHSYLSVTGGLSKATVIFIMKNGVKGISALKAMDHDGSLKASDILTAMSKTSPEDPIFDFIYDSMHKVKTIYCRCRSEITEAQKIAQSALNMYTPELLLKTALATYYEAKDYGRKYNRDNLIQVLYFNLSLLQENGIISIQTVDRYMNEIRKNI